MTRKRLIWVCSWLLAFCVTTRAASFTPFGPHGQGGTKNGQQFGIGASGLVHELDAFLRVAGMDLNGIDPGTSASLSRHNLPAGLEYQFHPALSADRTDVVLAYQFSNSTTTVFADLRFIFLLDTEISQTANTFFNEHGAVIGSSGSGPWDSSADAWQIDEPGFGDGTLIRDCLSGSLNNSNSIPLTRPDDVALALGFFLGDLRPGESLTVRILISEDGEQKGSLALVQRDASPDVTSVITLSGEADQNPVQEITTLVQMSFRWGLNPATGRFLGTLLLANPAQSGVTMGPPFRLGLRQSQNFILAETTGVLPNGLPYVDLSSAVGNQAGADGELDPGELVVVDGIEIFSNTQSPPPPDVFELWAARLR